MQGGFEQIFDGKWIHRLQQSGSDEIKRVSATGYGCHCIAYFDAQVFLP